VAIVEQCFTAEQISLDAGFPLLGMGEARERITRSRQRDAACYQDTNNAQTRL
jgi:hypothetical protein